jgi:hypothetical protein
MTGYCTQRHDAVVDKLEEGIRMLRKPTGKIVKIRIVRIDGSMTKNEEEYKGK